ncbi:MAG: TonB-dependent receptor [Prevotella sp.]|nr:TonB-dependent receptor [Prevotella sp.]
MKHLHVFIAALCSFTTSVHAQVAGRDTAAVMIDGVDVTATYAERAITASVPQQTIDTDDMRRLGIASMADALKHLSGITVRDYGGAGGMKTISVRGLGSRHTAVAYDGILLNDCQTGEIDLSRYSIEGISSMTLGIGDDDNIFMPARNMTAAATLYINPFSGKNRQPLTNGVAGLATGAWGLIQPYAHINRNIGDNLNIHATGEYLHADNNYPFTLTNIELKTRERRTNSKMNSGHVEGGIDWQIAPTTNMTAMMYYYDNDRQLPGIVRLYTNENDETLHDRNIFAQLSLRSDVGKAWRLMANGKWNWASTRYHNGMPTGGISSASYLQREWYGSMTTMYSPTQWLSASYSTDIIANSLNTQSNPSRTTWLQALAAKIGTPRLTATARLLRSDIYDSHDNGERHSEHRFSPSVSLSYRIASSEMLYLRAMWKEIFRMPTFNELYYYHIGSTSLTPERTSQMNIGITWQSRKMGRFTANATTDIYINKVKDKIVAIPFNMFIWRMTNIAEVRSVGVDANADICFSINNRQQLMLSQNYTWQRVENHTNSSSPYYGNQIAYTPEHTFATTLTWTNPWVCLSVSIDGMSHRWTTNEHSNGTRMGGFTEFGASAYRDFHMGNVTLTARVVAQNLLDKQYDIVAHYPMPGRAWKASIGVRF